MFFVCLVILLFFSVEVNDVKLKIVIFLFWHVFDIEENRCRMISFYEQILSKDTVILA